MSSLNLLTSSYLGAIKGLSHGFSDRWGGVSRAPYHELNLGGHVGDEPGAVTENRQRLVGALGVGGAKLATLDQVHGDTVVEVVDADIEMAQADAFYTTRRGIALLIQVADCTPILLADKDARVVAAVHAGWRGTQKKIAAATVQKLTNLGIDPCDLWAAVGPCIGFEAFAIGPEVVVELRQAYGSDNPAIVGVEGGRGRADLQRLNVDSLIDCGVPPSQIEVLAHCTVSESRWFSYRREEGQTGRQGAAIVLG